MKNKSRGLLILLIALAMSTYSQALLDTMPGKKADTVFVNNLLQQIKEKLSDEPAKARSLAIEARDLSEKIGYLKGKGYALKFIGLVDYYQGKFLEALGYWNESLQIFENIKDDNGVANLLNNISAIYSDQGNDEKALEYSLRSLKLSEKTGDKLRIYSALNGVGSIYYNKKATWDKALDYFLRALPLCEELGDKDALGVILGNVGDIYFYKHDLVESLSYYQKAIKAYGELPNSSFAYNGVGKIYLEQGNFIQALIYHNKALSIAEKSQSRHHMVRSFSGIANVYVGEKDYQKALVYLTKASKLAEEINATPDLKDIYQDMAIAYSKTADYKNAFKYQTLYASIKDTLYNIETDKKLGTLQFDFDLQKKEGQISLLTKDKALQELDIKRQKIAKNALLGGLGLVFIITMIIYRDYRNKIRVNKVLDNQKAEIEGLLLNILPAEVAQELQKTGAATPRYYERASVLFTDFKSFSKLADDLSPQDVVTELNECFVVFDDIIEKYHLEKIKTIGDSYMCAGGIPTADEHHIINIIKASIEIQEFTSVRNQKRLEMNLPQWEIRIGIHTGPLVAGVVGKKKYAYDIWGGTVNIASRMESNGEPGRVNISAATYEFVKDKFSCSYRGKIYAKNIGEIDMYFVDHELS